MVYVFCAVLLEAVVLKVFSTLNYQSRISLRAGLVSPGASLVGLLSVSGAGCSIHRFAWRSG